MTIDQRTMKTFVSEVVAVVEKYSVRRLPLSVSYFRTGTAERVCNLVLTFHHKSKPCARIGLRIAEIENLAVLRVCMRAIKPKVNGEVLPAE